MGTLFEGNFQNIAKVIRKAISHVLLIYIMSFLLSNYLFRAMYFIPPVIGIVSIISPL